MNTIVITKKIRDQRESLGITQKEIAEKLFIDTRSYSNFERGKKKNIDIGFLSDLAKILALDINVLLKEGMETKDTTELPNNLLTINMDAPENNIENLLFLLEENTRKLTNDISDLQSINSELIQKIHSIISQETSKANEIPNIATKKAAYS